MKNIQTIKKAQTMKKMQFYKVIFWFFFTWKKAMEFYLGSIHKLRRSERGEGGQPKTYLTSEGLLIKWPTWGEGGQKSPIFDLRSLWMLPKGFLIMIP